MDKGKRGFLKAAGASIVGALGLGWAQSVADRPKPVTKPLPDAFRGRRLGLAIDIKACRREGGCTACIDACHRAHNVPRIADTNEEVKWVWKEAYGHTFPTQSHRYTETALREASVLVLCNHCDNPPCVRVCPTQATWKRESDGLVMMDQHRCIGCRYCMVACPYGSRSFNWQDPRSALGNDLSPDYPTRTKGVVEKCNFCAERLAQGQLPVCVEACRERTDGKALVFGDLEDPKSEISRLLQERHSIRRKPALGTEPMVFYLV